MSQPSQAHALDGVRVIDFGQYMAGPLAAMLLGDQGAEVIRVDPPGGPRWNTPANATWNRNKQSIVLDLKQERDCDIARELIASADVVIENFRPGVMQRLGLGADAMTALNPRLIYCSMPGFAVDDPRASVRAWEGVLGAATGAYRSREVPGRPVFTVVPYASAYAALLCTVATAMALNAREHTGVGQRIDIPLFDATFAVIGVFGFLVDGQPIPFPDLVWSRPLPCKDGRWIMHVANNKNARTFFEKIGMAQYRNAGLDNATISQHYEAISRTRTAKEWEDYCAEIGTEGVICHTSEEWLQHPQGLESGIIATFDDPELGSFNGPGINVRLSRTPGSVRRPRVRPDSDRATILADLARRRSVTSAATSAAPSPARASSDLRMALQGVKVLDLCIVLAGPTCGRTLAEFGADVIKIDSPYVSPILRHNEVNRVKRSLLIDLKTPEGLEVFWKLLDEADVVLENFRHGVCDRLGIGYEALRARKPDIIHASMNAFGYLGPFATRPGHDQMGQAISGMKVRYGDERPEMAPFAANDYGTGLMAAYGVALALLHRQRTGEGQRVDSSLSYTATILQSNLMQEFAGKVWDEPRGQSVLGYGPLDRAYAASDAWLYLAARPQDLKLCPALADLASLQGKSLEQALEQRLATRPVAAWVNSLQAAGIGAHQVVDDLRDLMLDPLVVKRGLSVTRDLDGFGAVTMTGPAVKMSGTPVRLGKLASKPGSDAPAILAEIGLAGELQRLIDKGVVVIDGVKAGC